MEELGQSLDLDEFIDAACRLYDAVQIPQRNILLSVKDKWQRSKMDHETTTFKPQLNQNSLKIAAKRRPDADISQILMNKQKVSSSSFSQEYEQKLQQRMLEHENSDLIGCTFHPNITQSPDHYSSCPSRANPPRRPSTNAYVYNQQPLDLNNLANNVAHELNYPLQ